MTAVKNNGEALEFADDSLKSDRVIASLAVSNSVKALHHVKSEKMTKKDYAGILKEAVRKSPDAFELASPNVWSDTKLILEIIEKNPLALNHIHGNLKRDENFAMEVVKQNGLAIEHLLPMHRKNYEICVKAFEQNVKSIEFMDKTIRVNKTAMLRAIELNPEAIKYVDQSLINCRADKFLYEAMDINGLALQYVDLDRQNSQEIILRAIKQNPEAIKFVCRSFKELMKKATEEYPFSLNYLDDDEKKLLD